MGSHKQKLRKCICFRGRQREVCGSNSNVGVQCSSQHSEFLSTVGITAAQMTLNSLHCVPETRMKSLHCQLYNTAHLYKHIQFNTYHPNN